MNLSIIIPTKNRNDLLFTCLKRLTPQLKKGDEIIIADNSQSQQAKKLIYFFNKNNIKYISCKNGGASGSRNKAFKIVKKKGVAFVDDDSFVASNWLNIVKKTLEKDFLNKKPAIYQGLVRQHYLKRGLLEQIRIDYYNRMLSETGMNSKKTVEIKSLIVCNIFALKQTFTKVSGPFNSKDFPFMGEDQDLACRLILNGIPIIYSPNTIVLHTKKGLTLSQTLKSYFAYGRSKALLSKLYYRNSKFLLMYNAIQIPKPKSQPVKTFITKSIFENAAKICLLNALNTAYITGYFYHRFLAK